MSHWQLEKSQSLILLSKGSAQYHVIFFFIFMGSYFFLKNYTYRINPTVGVKTAETF